MSAFFSEQIGPDREQLGFAERCTRVGNELLCLYGFQDPEGGFDPLYAAWGISEIEQYLLEN